MTELAEKRIYNDRAGATTLLVAAAPGLVRVSVSGGRVGEFGVARDCTPVDLSVVDTPEPPAGSRLAVATEEEVLLAGPRDADALEPAGFGPATAVTFGNGRPVAAGPDGRLATRDENRWTDLGQLPAAATALDGDLVGTAEGVFRLSDREIRPAGLTDVTDIARSAGIPIVATGAGLYELGNGWLDVLEGAFAVVAGATDGRAHAMGDDGFYVRTGETWERQGLPVDAPIAAAAYGPRTYLFTVDGDLLVEDEDGWAYQPLGLGSVSAAVVV